MPKLILDNCCFCWDLRTGCFIIAYINVITQSLGLLVALGALIAGGVMCAKSAPELDVLALALVIAGIICLILFIIWLTFSTVFLVGLKKNKPRNVMVYIVFSVISLVFSFAGLIVTVPYSRDASSTIIGIIGIMYAIYLILVVRSYYYQMLQESTNSPNNTTNSPNTYTQQS